MSLLAQLLVAWFGINLLILALMWHNANERRRRREAYELQRQNALHGPGQTHLSGLAPAAAAPAGDRITPGTASTAAEPSRVVVMVNGDTPARRLRQPTPVLQVAQSPGARHADCDCEALRAEIRSLRLSVAELSIDRASLLAKLQPRPPARAATSPRSATSQP